MMFLKTRLRLAFMTAGVVFALMVLSGGVLYVFMKDQLFAEFDRSVQLSMMPVLRKLELGRDPLRNQRGIIAGQTPLDRTRQPLAVVFWGSGRRIVVAPPFLNRDNLQVLLKHLLAAPTTLKMGGHYFRVESFSVDISLPTGASQQITLQSIRNVDDIVLSLHKLGGLLLVLAMAGAFGSVVIGFFMASRALIPIERSWQRQRQFVADASHELRTPIMAVQSRAELLLQNPEQTIEEAAPKILSMYSELRHVTRLLKDLLTLSRADSQQQQIEKKEVRMDVIIGEVIDNIRPLCEENHLDLTVNGTAPITQEIDEERFRQMLYILLDNAIKYNVDGGSIAVSYGKERRFELRVTDSGVGISEKDLPHVFERFYRADSARSLEGSGLGLSIARWVAEEHGASMRIYSTVGEGTTVTVVFP